MVDSISREADKRDPARRIAGLSPAKLEMLARQLKERKVRAERTPSILPRNGSENCIPLLPSQQDVWLMDQLHPDLAFFTMPGSWPFKGRVNLNALEQALNETVRRHEILRTTFPAIKGEPAQVIAQACSEGLPIVDLRGLSEMDRWKQAKQLSLQDRLRKFHLDREWPLRMRFLILNQDELVLLHSIHHIAFDAWSSSVFMTEREALYKAFSNGSPSSLAELPIQCGDIALWQQEWLKGEEAEAQLSYWKRQLDGSSPELELPTDRPRTGRQFRGAWQRTLLSPTSSDALKKLTHEEGATLFITMLAGLNGLLYRYTGRDDISVGTLFSTRNRSEIEKLVGPFFNTLVLRTQLRAHSTFRELLRRVRQVTLEAYSHSDFPFAELTETMRSSDGSGFGPLFRVRFGMGPAQSIRTSGELIGMAIDGFNHFSNLNLGTEIPRNVNPARNANGQRGPNDLAVSLDYDLAVYIHEVGDQLEIRAWYNANLFDAATTARMLASFRVFLEEVSRNPDQQVERISLLTEASRHHLLEEWNDSRSDNGQRQTFSELFEAQVERTPDAVAVAFEDEQVSYRELGARAGRLAHNLQALGVGLEGLVAVMLNRGIEFLTVMLGAFQAGAAYLPLDPSDPSTRLNLILSESKANLVLTTNELMADIAERLESMPPQARPAVIAVETLLREQPAGDFAARCVPGNRAYVMYTSGSTGAPKGVMIEQAGMVNHLLAKIQELKLTEADSIIQNASERFDISVWQFLAALLVGARVRIINDETAQAPFQLLYLVEREAITILEVVPSLLGAVIEEMMADATVRRELSSLRWLLVTGEEISPETCAQWISLYPGLPLLNAYGPTECSDDVTHYAIRESPSTDVTHMPIGRPVRNTRLHVLDAMKLLAPIGVPGELYVGGQGVGRGYLHDPRRTAEVFIPDPFSAEPGARLYRTGDLVRCQPDGNIEYRGRLDHQVKVRGFRIELAEIELALGWHPGVQQAVVIAREDQPGDKCLVAYVVARREPAPASKDLSDFLRESLPDYMVPSAFVVLDAMPLTSNGKIDRRALPAPNEFQSDDQDCVAPASPIEKKVAEIWSEMFKGSKIGIYDNFFHLGGHSIKAVRVINRINQAFNVNLSVRNVFEEPTVAGLALLIEETLIEKLEAE